MSTNASEDGFTLGAKNLYELIVSSPGDEVTHKKADNHWVGNALTCGTLPPTRHVPRPAAMRRASRFADHRATRRRCSGRRGRHSDPDSTSPATRSDTSGAIASRSAPLPCW